MAKLPLWSGHSDDLTKAAVAPGRLRHALRRVRQAASGLAFQLYATKENPRQPEPARARG